MNRKNKLADYTGKEKAEALIFPSDLPTKNRKKATSQLAAARKKGQLEMTEEVSKSLELLRLKFQIEDYIQNKEFNSEMTFGSFLERYVGLLQQKRKEFAHTISIDESLLSQFINQHRLPPDYVAVRLEIHSNNSISAGTWLKLVEKQKEFELQNDKAIRKKEKKYVLATYSGK